MQMEDKEIKCAYCGADWWHFTPVKTRCDIRRRYCHASFAALGLKGFAMDRLQCKKNSKKVLALIDAYKIDANEKFQGRPLLNMVAKCQINVSDAITTLLNRGAKITNSAL